MNTEISHQCQTEESSKKEKNPTFESIFYPEHADLAITVPDYQRAYSWEKKQIDLFISDLQKYEGRRDYYFGHFIVEENADKHWDMVDGQQRLTTFVLFLMICRHLLPEDTNPAYSMITRYRTVRYDAKIIFEITEKFSELMDNLEYSSEHTIPTHDEIRDAIKLSPEDDLTRSLSRIVLALLRFHAAFKRGDLKQSNITNYIEVIMKAHCSYHLTKDKSVAVNIFEMHNTRGVPLSTLEVVKAKLMQFVYDYGGSTREESVKVIQQEFGEIYAMEQLLSKKSFRGQMTTEQLLRLHLRVVDDGCQDTAAKFDLPRMNSSPDDVVDYVSIKLRYSDGDKTKAERPRFEGVEYAKNLAKEFKLSMNIISRVLPAWDDKNALIGDVLILEPSISCEFFLVACRLVDKLEDLSEVLPFWERLLFTRDFHNAYHGKSYRDNFPVLFYDCATKKSGIKRIICNYVKDGFRPGSETKDLQSVVRIFIEANKNKILENAFIWRKKKMEYAIYKFETSNGANIRDEMKGVISVEHILPQNWKLEWLEGFNQLSPEQMESMSSEIASKRKEIFSYINGLGNLLILARRENSSLGDKHPAKKIYESKGGTYCEHNINRNQWISSSEWRGLINNRGNKIFKFMMSELIGGNESIELG